MEDIESEKNALHRQIDVNLGSLQLERFHVGCGKLYSKTATDCNSTHFRKSMILFKC